jgi:hypothetical protein
MRRRRRRRRHLGVFISSSPTDAFDIFTVSLLCLLQLLAIQLFCHGHSLGLLHL